MEHDQGWLRIYKNSIDKQSVDSYRTRQDPAQWCMKQALTAKKYETRIHNMSW